MRVAAAAAAATQAVFATSIAEGVGRLGPDKALSRRGIPTPRGRAARRSPGSTHAPAPSTPSQEY
jgi:hypothetical protein